MISVFERVDGCIGIRVKSTEQALLTTLLTNKQQERKIHNMMYVPRPSQLIRGPNLTLLVNLDHTIMILDPRGYQVVQAGVSPRPYVTLHSSPSSTVHIHISSTIQIHIIYR